MLNRGQASQTKCIHGRLNTFSLERLPGLLYTTYIYTETLKVVRLSLRIFDSKPRTFVLAKLTDIISLIRVEDLTLNIYQGKDTDSLSHSPMAHLTVDDAIKRQATYIPMLNLGFYKRIGEQKARASLNKIDSTF